MHVIKNSSVTLLIGNNCAAAHCCLESRFSFNPKAGPNIILTSFGWTLKGSLLMVTQAKENASNFLIRDLKWASEVQPLKDIILTYDEGEMFSIHLGTDFCDKESLIKAFQDYIQILEFGFIIPRKTSLLIIL